MIQKGSHNHLSQIEEATSKSDLEAMLLRGNYKSAKSDLNASVLEKAIEKEIKHEWSLTFTIDSIRHIKTVGVVPPGVAEELSINKKGERYTKRRVTYD